MDSDRFDAIAKRISEAASRRSLVTGVAAGAAGAVLALIGGAQGDDRTAEARKRAQKKEKRDTERTRERHEEEKKREQKRENRAPECDKDAACPQPSDPCKKRVCQGGKCDSENRQDGTDCGGGSTCVNGKCQAATPECQTSADCIGALAGACVNGFCAPVFQICDLGGATSAFVTGASPAQRASSLRMDVGNDGLDAVHLNTGEFAGTLLSDLETLDYTTFVPTGDHCGMAPYIVLLVQTPIPPTPLQLYDILIYDPGVDNDPPPTCDRWQTWHARNGKYRSIFHNDFAPQHDPQTLDAYDAMFGPASLFNLALPTPSCPNIVGGLRIEVGHGGASEGGWQHFSGFVDSLRIKVSGQPARTFDF